MRRAAQLLWVLACLDDIDSDMSVFHRVDDFRVMPGPRFFALASRLSAYQGAMRARAEAALAEAASAGQPAAPPVRRLPASVTERPSNVPAVPAVIKADPDLGRIFSFGTFSKD